MSTNRLDEVICEIEKQRQTQKRVVVSIAGGSCTRKSSLISAILAGCFKENAILISQDTFQLQPSYKENIHTDYMWDHPNNFGISECYNALTKLKQNQSVEAPNYNFKKEESITYKTIAPAPVIIFEGLYANYGKLQNINDINIYVKSRWYARMIRRIFRNTLDRYKGREASSILESFCNSVTKAHVDFVTSQEKLADDIIEVPLKFSNIIKHYNLKPINQKIEVTDTFFFIECDDDILFKIIRIESEKFEFMLFYNKKLYLSFTIDSCLADRLKNIDWLAY